MNEPSRKQAKSEARAAALERLKAEQKAKKRRRTLLQVGAVVVAVLVIVGGTIGVQKLKDNKEAEVAASSTPPAAVDDDGAFVVGDKDAPVTIQVVEDFQCPICKNFEAAAGEVLDQYAAGKDVKVAYRGIAFLDGQSTTDYSSRALNASACVMDSGAEVWKEFHRQMYLQQPAEGSAGLTDDQIVSIATAAGADESTVASCVADGTYDGWVSATTDKTLSGGVNGTPAVFVDGTMVESSVAAIQAAVTEALAS